MSKEEEFLNKRVRIQRLGDLKFFSGWCTRLKGQLCVLTINPGKASYSVDDEFNVEIYGPEKRATFTAKVVRLHSNGCDLQLKSSIRLLQTDEEARVLISGLVGQIYYEDEAVTCQALDISPHGLGGEVKDEIPRGTKVKFKFSSPIGDIKGAAEVRYCRETSEGVYRIGLRLPELDRMDGGRWMALMQEPSELG